MRCGALGLGGRGSTVSACCKLHAAGARMVHAANGELAWAAESFHALGTVRMSMVMIGAGMPCNASGAYFRPMQLTMQSSGGRDSCHPSRLRSAYRVGVVDEAV